MKIIIPKSVLYKLISEYEYKIKYNLNELNINTEINYNLLDWILILKNPNIINIEELQIAQIIRIDINANSIHNKIYINTNENENLVIYKNNINSSIIFTNYLNNLSVINLINNQKLTKDMLKITNLIIQIKTNKVITWN